MKLNKESQLILQMVAEGKINVEDGNDLLKLVETKPKMTPAWPEKFPGRVTGLSLVTALKAAGIAPVTSKDLQELINHNLTAEFVQEITALGLLPESTGEWIKLRVHHVTPDFVREFQDLGYSDLSLDQLVKFRIHDVQSHRAADLLDLGLELSPEELLKFQIHNVESISIQAVLDLGFSDIPVETWLWMTIHKVPLHLIRESREVFGESISLDEIIRMHLKGMSPGD